MGPADGPRPADDISARQSRVPVPEAAVPTTSSISRPLAVLILSYDGPTEQPGAMQANHGPRSRRGRRSGCRQKHVVAAGADGESSFGATLWGGWAVLQADDQAPSGSGQTHDNTARGGLGGKHLDEEAVR